MIGAGLLGFGTRIAQQIDKTGNTIGGWFGSGEDVFGDGSSNQPEIAFAVYSADDNSLDFYKRTEVPEVGDNFEFKTVTEVYTGFETGTYTLVETPTDRYGSSTAPWAVHQSQIETVTVVDTGIAPESVSVWFANMTNLKTVDVAKIDTSECRQMFDAFFRARKLKSLDLSSWDVSKTWNFSCMFQECHSLENINMKGWSVHASQTGMFGMFFDCMSLQSLDLSGFASIPLQSLVPTKCSVIANRCPKSLSVLIGNGSSMTMVREQIPICRLLLQNISVGQTASGIAFRLARDTRSKTFRITRPILM